MNGVAGIEKAYDLIEKVCGRFVAKLLVWVLVAAALAGAFALIWTQFAKHVVEFVASSVRGADIDVTKTPQLLVTILALLLLLVVAFIIVGLVRSLARRRVPQQAIDDLAELRSEGIAVLNDVPKGEADLDRWRTSWMQWRERVVQNLQKNFTHAERLSFDRLGVIRESQFGFAINNEHQHCLMQLAKQLRILEEMIQRHLDRR